jgi:signal transduction histidine kinase/CheY-like chemotaxis protein
VILKTLLTPPVFNDEEKSHEAHLLYLILGFMLFLPAPLLISAYIYTPDRLPFFISLTGIAEIINIFLFVLLYRGRIRLSSILQIAGFWIFTTMSAYLGSGIRSEAYLLGYGCSIITAGILIGFHEALIVSLLSVLSGLVLLLLEITSTVQFGSLSPAAVWWGYSIILFPLIAISQLYWSKKISSALEQTKHNESALRDRVQKLHFLRELSVLYSQILNLKAFCEKVYEIFPKYFPELHITILFYDAAKNALVSDDIFGITRFPHELHPDIQELGFSVSGKCFIERRPILVNNCATTDLIPKKYVELYQLKSTLAVPMLRQDSTWGVVRIDDKNSYNAFHEDDIEYFSMLADQFTVAIENNKLFLERKITEEAMLQTQKMESLGILAGGVAHDFNNLLQAILGHADLVATKLEKSHSAHHNIASIEKAARSASELTQQLLAYSGRGKFHIGVINVNEIIRINFHLWEVSIPKNVHLHFFPFADIYPVEADLGQLQQVIMNLIINAGEAIGTKNGSITISTSNYSVSQDNLPFWSRFGSPPSLGEYAMIEVRDDGIGMTPETLSRIFDPFFTTKFTGRGLGLAAVLGIVRGHHGRLSVESTEGNGTVFKVIFPESKKDYIVPQKTETSDVRFSGSVLVIDDEDEVREIVTEALEMKELKVYQAADGLSGLEVYSQHGDEISLVILDLSMPGMGGEETFRCLRNINPNVRIIISSGYSETEVADFFANEKVSGFLQKPFTMETLYAAVGRQIG